MILAHAHVFSSTYKDIKEGGDEEELNNLVCSEDRHPNEDHILKALEAPYEDLMVLPDGSVVQIYEGDCLVWSTVKDLFLSAHWDTGEYMDEEEAQRIALAAFEKIKHLI